MKLVINKSLAVLAVVMLTISIASCSKGSDGIVDPTKGNDQNDQNSSIDGNNSNDIDYNTNQNNNTGN